MNRNLRKRLKERITEADTRRRGFTLVEMLVAVALTLLMMTLFAQIFVTATSTISTQRGLAENDQRARRVQTMLKEDLNRMTFRALPNAAGLEAILPNISDYLALSEPDSTYQIGYFYISENKPEDDTDDVIQFTIRAAGSQIWEDEEAEPFVGKTVRLGTIATEINQPEADDGDLVLNVTQLEFGANSNGKGSSNFAEVCYFLRNGNLYRRISLLRQPIDDSAAEPPELQGNYGGPNAFWNDFSYSAFFDYTAATPNIELISDAALSNQTAMAPPVSLGIPKYRFGFWGDTATASPGYPREYLDAAETLFIGRFTHEETSHPLFLYPGQDVTDGSGSNYYMNTLIKDGSVDLADADNNGVVDGLEGGARRSEDLILSNVHAFNIEVFDPGSGELLNASGQVTNPGTGAFEDLGHSRENDSGTQIGFFNKLNNANLGSDGAPGVAGTDDDMDGNVDYLDPPTNSIPDADEIGWAGSDDYGNRWDSWHRDSALIGGGLPPYSASLLNGGAGADGQPGVAGVDDDGANGPDDPGELGWPGSDDVTPLRAIRITVRFYDVSSAQMRDLTIVHSFSDRDAE